MRRNNPQLPCLTRKALCLAAASTLTFIAACSSTSTTPNSTTTSGPQTYFAPPAAGTTYNIFASDGKTITSIALAQAQTFTIDDQTPAGQMPMFSQTAFGLHNQAGPQVLNAGTVSMLQGGLRGLSISANYVYNGNVTPSTFGLNLNPPGPGSFAVELAGQAGGLVQMLGQPAVPMVAATQCPSFSSAQTYQFITIPNGFNQGTVAANTFNPILETVYGSVGIVTNGSDVTFQNIQQNTLTSAGMSGPITGTCGPTILGYTTQIPGQLVVTNPGSTSPAQNIPPQASIGIGPSGLLVEYNGVSNTGGTMPNTTPALSYDNILGAGTGAVGLPKPSSPLSTSAVVGAQYLGFIYGAGVGSSATGWSSYAASFGGSSLPSGCPNPSPSSPLLSGGDFPNNNPAVPGAQANLDFAIDLGPPQDSSNSLYTQVVVCVGSGYATNPAPKPAYHFSAVAIAGTLGGKYAIFIIGFDPALTPPSRPAQPWAIYLLQSN